MKQLSIKTKLILLMIVTIIVVSAFISFKAIFSLKNLAHEDIESYKESSFDIAQNELKASVYFASNIVKRFHRDSAMDKIKANIKNDLQTQIDFLLKMLNSLYSDLNGKVPDKQLQKILLDSIGKARFGKNNSYFFVYNQDAVVLKHPVNPAKEGKNTPHPIF